VNYLRWLFYSKKFIQKRINIATKLKEGILQIDYNSLGSIYRLVFLPNSYRLLLIYMYYIDNYLWKSCYSSGGYLSASHCGGPGLISVHVEYVLDKVTRGKSFSRYFWFPYQFSFHQLLHTHLIIQHYTFSILTPLLNNQVKYMWGCNAMSFLTPS
jgi:hypothetical protein